MDLFNEFASSLEASGTITMEKQPRKLRRSCEPCRNSKGRCYPSKEDYRCERCLKEGKECIFLETKARPKRAKNSRIRVAEMEEKINGIFTLLASSRTLMEGETPPSLPGTLPPPEPSSSSHSSSITTQISPPYSGPAFSTSGIFQLPNLGLGAVQDVITKGLVTFEEAEHCLEFFRAQAHRFPFVLVRPGTSLNTIRRERPFLLLAILAFATQAKPKLQEQIELEVRESLSKRVVVNMEKSLDVLQGLLVYLAWYHLYLQPDREPVYQLTQMAIFMAIDLGINKPPPKAAVAEVAIVPNPPMAFQTRISPAEVESRRTFLGCYYLSSALRQGSRKPGNLNYSEYIEESCQILAQTADAETDHLLQYFIRLQQFSDKVNLAFDYDNILSSPPPDAGRIESLSKAFNQQLKQMEADFPAEIWDNATITTSFLNLRIYVSEIGLHLKSPTAPDLRNHLLLSSQTATHHFLSYYISLPMHSILQTTIVTHLRLIYALLIFGSLATSPFSATLPSPPNYIQYLDALIAKYSAVPGSGLVYHMIGFFRKSKAWYEQKMGEGRGRGDGEMDTSFVDILPTILSRCIDFWGQEEGETQIEEVYREGQEIWGSWP